MNPSLLGLINGVTQLGPKKKMNSRWMVFLICLFVTDETFRGLINLWCNWFGKNGQNKNIANIIGFTVLIYFIERITIIHGNVFYYVSQNFGRHIVFAFAVYLSVCLSIHNKLVWLSQIKLLVGFQPNFTGEISTNPSCAC